MGGCLLEICVCVGKLCVHALVMCYVYEWDIKWKRRMLILFLKGADVIKMNSFFPSLWWEIWHQGAVCGRLMCWRASCRDAIVTALQIINTANRKSVSKCNRIALSIFKCRFSTLLNAFFAQVCRLLLHKTTPLLLKLEAFGTRMRCRVWDVRPYFFAFSFIVLIYKELHFSSGFKPIYTSGSSSGRASGLSYSYHEAVQSLWPILWRDLQSDDDYKLPNVELLFPLPGFLLIDSGLRPLHQINSTTLCCCASPCERCVFVCLCVRDCWRVEEIVEVLSC